MTNKARYAQFCADQAHEEVPIFMQPWYLDATAGPDGWDAAIAMRQGKVLGIWPYVLKRRWLFQSVTMPPFLRFCGPLLSEEVVNLALQSSLLKEMEAQLPKVARFSQDLPYACPVKLIADFGFRRKERFSYVLEDIHRQDEVYYGIKADYRNNKLPKAEKAYTWTDEVDLDTFLEMHRKVYKRQKLKLPADDAYFRRLDAALAAHGARAILGAKHQETGKIDAVAYLIAWKGTCYLLASADDVDARKQAPSIFILWQSIRYAFHHFGATQFDFLGSMVPSIASVRKQFGAKPVAYWRIERFTGLGWLVRFLK
jgi:hypothetical protein